jgi:hypothetical protein
LSLATAHPYAPEQQYYGSGTIPTRLPHRSLVKISSLEQRTARGMTAAMGVWFVEDAACIGVISL